MYLECMPLASYTIYGVYSGGYCRRVLDMTSLPPGLTIPENGSIRGNAEVGMPFVIYCNVGKVTTCG